MDVAPATVASGDVIEIVVPAEARLISTVRLVAASFAADLGFDMDEIDDLHVALTEVLMALAGAPDARARIVFAIEPTGLTTSIEAIGEQSRLPLDPRALATLRSVVASVEVDATTVRFSKHRSAVRR